MSKRPDDIQPSLLWYRQEKPPTVESTVLTDGTKITARSSGVSYVAYANPESHTEGCDVYWGSHGCCRPAGHDGDHWCDCCDCANHPDPDSGCVAGPPYYGPDTRFYN